MVVAPRRAHIVFERILAGGDVDTVGDEAENGADPEQHREAAEQILAELHPLGHFLRRTERVRTVPLHDLPRLLISQALTEI